jgi:cobalt/nickel transport protein
MKNWGIAVVLLVIAALLVIFLSPYASDKPDGLEYVAQEKGFLERTEGKEVLKTAPLPDYSVQGVENEHASTVIAGVIGMAACLVIALGIGFALKKRKKETHEARSSG